MKLDLFISMGSNIGDKEKNLIEALCKINAVNGICLEKVSGIYETKPVGYLEQDDFYNIAVKCTTYLKPIDVLDCFLSIEAEMKRERTIRWGPRIIDIDILLYEDVQMSDEKLIIPHPRMFERAFVLVPLKEIIESDLFFRYTKRDIDFLINIYGQNNDIKYVKSINLDDVLN